MRSERDSILARMKEVDVAYHILKQRGQPVYFRDLIEEILRIKPVDSANWAKAAAAIYTQLNLDTRFSYQGKGKWSLRSGAISKAPRRVSLKRTRGAGSDLLKRGRRLRLLVRRGDGLDLETSPEAVEEAGSLGE